MKDFIVTITDSLGIHARPAGMLVKEAKKYQSTITLATGSKTGDAKKIFAVMALGVKKSEKVKVMVEGSDEELAAAAMKSFFQENF